MLKLLPTVPTYSYGTLWTLWYPICRITMPEFSPGGSCVGPALSKFVFDGGSWGQFIGGTASRRGQNKGFIDSSHVVGRAIVEAGHRPVMLCGMHTAEGSIAIRQTPTNLTIAQSPSPFRPSSNRCYTAPFIRCHEQASWTPLFNLHIHSKQTSQYVSQWCPC